MKKLTRAEEDMMLVLWKLNKAFLKDIIAAFPDPKPNQSTVSTILRTLERKGYARHTAYSKVFEYVPSSPNAPTAAYFSAISWTNTLKAPMRSL